MLTLTKKKAREQFVWGWALILPTIIGLVILNIIPIFQTIYLTFFKTGAFGLNNIFIGLANYKKAFNDVIILKAIRNTFIYMLLEVPASIIISLLLAFILNQKMKLRGFYRTVIFLPMVAAPAAVAMVWKWLYNTEFGLINHIFHINVSWLTDSRITLVSVAIIGIWSAIGYNMVLFLAALQDVSKDYYEAAELDGASKFMTFYKVVLPIISPTIYFVLVTRIIAAMQVFDNIYMVMDMTNPTIDDTQSLVMLFFRYSFVEGNWGYGSTIAIILLIIVLFITLLQRGFERKWVFYDD